MTAGSITGYEEKKDSVMDRLDRASSMPESTFSTEGCLTGWNGVPLSLEKELVPVFSRKRFYGYVSDGKFIDIGTPDSYAMAGSYLEGAHECVDYGRLLQASRGW